MNYRLRILFVNFICVLLLFMPSSALTSVSWGIDIGDSAVYWIDEIRSTDTGEANLAVFLGDQNRTINFISTSKDISSMNYTLGLRNSSEILDQQQIRIEEIDFQGNKVMVPNGTLPIVLPISAGNQNNYLQYLASSTELGDVFIQELISNFNISEFSTVEASGNYRTDLFNLSAEIKLENLEDLLDLNFFGINISDGLQNINNNITVLDVSATIKSTYNSSDGMLMRFFAGATVNRSIILGENINSTEILEYNATIIRQSYDPLKDVVSEIKITSSEIISIITVTEESNFNWFIGYVTLISFYQIWKKRMKIKKKM